QAVIVKQTGLPATATGDKTLVRLEAARKLIAANRGKSIAALSAMLKRVYLAQAEDEIEKRSKEVQPAHQDLMAAAFGHMREELEAYGRLRGPLIAKLSVVARSTSLEPQAAPSDGDAVMLKRIADANELRSQIRALDKEYDSKADGLMAEAEKAIQAEIAH